MTSIKLLILSILTSSISLTGFAHFSESHSSPVNKKKETIPPGTVKIHEGFFFDATEISNFNWQEYVYWNKNKYGESSTLYLETIPDTNIWGANSSYVTNYYKHVSYRNYPVVGISYEQANAFCNWRSDRVNEVLFAQENKEAYAKYLEDNNAVKIPKLFAYRLPTQVEWEKVANAPFSEKTIRRQKDKDLIYNLKQGDSNFPIGGNSSDVTAPITSYSPNIYGVFNILGNVSEMIDEKGVSKGGSWCNSMEESRTTKQLSYTGPANWLGFRCVCEKL